MTERELLLTSMLKCRRVGLYVDPRPLSARQQARLDKMLTRRSQGEPLQYIIGSCEFMGFELDVDPRVLIPRPETELLTETVIKEITAFPKKGNLNILDLGTGSGNIAVSLAKLINGCSVTAVDLSSDALAVAESNAARHKADNIRFIRSDLYAFIHGQSPDERKVFDVIISNPPYIPTPALTSLPLDVQQEPSRALDGGPDGLSVIRRIIMESHCFLTPDGFLIFEIGDGQRAAVEEIFKESLTLKITHCLKDLNGIERIIIGRHKTYG